MLLLRSPSPSEGPLAFFLLSLSRRIRSHAIIGALILLFTSFCSLYFVIGCSITHAVVIAMVTSMVLLKPLFYYNSKYIDRVAVVPVVPDDSWVGNVGILCGKQSHRTLLHWTNTLGPVFQFCCYGRTIVVVTDPALARVALRDIVSKGDLNYAHGGSVKNTLTLDTNDAWKVRRSCLSQAYTGPTLHRTENEVTIQSHIANICDVLDTFANTEILVDIDVIIGKEVISILCAVIFGFDTKDIVPAFDLTALHKDMRLYSHLRGKNGNPLQSALFYLPSFKSKQLRDTESRLKAFCSIVFKNIALSSRYALANPLVLSNAYADLACQSGITNDDVINEILLVFVAGYESICHTLSWYVYTLCKSPEIQNEVLKHVHNSRCEVFDATNLALKYPDEFIEAVIKESMRKYTVSSHCALRRVSQVNGLQLGRIHLPYDTWVYVPLYALHNSKLNWGEDSDQIVPERFRQRRCSFNTGCESNETKTDPNELKFAPFSYGSRGCLGMNLALMIVKLTVMQLSSKFTFSFPELSLMSDEALAVESCCSLCPKDGMPVLVASRTDHQ